MTGGAFGGQMISAPASSIARLFNTVGADIIRPSFLLLRLLIPTRNYGKGTDYNKYGQMISAPTSSIARLFNTVGADIIRPSFLLVHLSTPTRNYGEGTD